MQPSALKLIAPFLAAMVLIPPPIGAAEMKEVAYKERLLCFAVAPEDAALFDRYFGSAVEPIADGWDSENLVQYSSSRGRNKTGKWVLRESLMILAEDGSRMRKLFCERFETNLSKRVNFKEEEYSAVVPFVFAYNLVNCVDYNDETLYADWVRFNPQSRQIEGIERKHWTRRELYSMRGELTEKEKSLFDTYFPKHRLHRIPPTWDAEQRVLYSARGKTGSRGAYALNGTIKQVSTDGCSCRIATKTLERRGAWKGIGRPVAYQLPMVKPFVFVEGQSFDIIFHIEQFNPQTGAYEGTRTKVYDFRSMELVGDVQSEAPALTSLPDDDSSDTNN